MNESKAATSGERRIYVWWGAGFAFLALLAIFGWYFLRPYLEVRAAVGRLNAMKSSDEDEVKALGGPEQAAAKCSLYIRCPERLATKHEKARVFWILVACGQPAFPWAESLLRSRNAYVRANAAWALGRLKDHRAVGPLAGALKDANAHVRYRAAGALCELNDPRAVEPLIATLKDSDADVRRWAAQALGELKDLRAVEPLKELLADPDSFVRSTAEKAIKQIEAAKPAEK